MTKISLHQKNKQISGSKRKAWPLPVLKAYFVGVVISQLFPSWKVISIGLGFYTATSVVEKITKSDEDDKKGLLISKPRLLLSRLFIFCPSFGSIEDI